MKRLLPEEGESLYKSPKLNLVQRMVRKATKQYRLWVKSKN